MVLDATPKHCSIIGKIPGYNSNIDSSGKYQQILLRDITYIDLLPATYSINKSITNFITGDGNKQDLSKELYTYSSGLGGSNNSEYTVGMFKNILGNMATYLQTQFIAACENGSNNYKQLYGVNYDQMIDEAKKAITDFGNGQSIRILAANDSTFTETVSNTYTPKGTLDNISQAFLNKGPQMVQEAAGLMQKAQAISYDNALKTLTNFSSNGSLMDIISGKLLGLQFASPNAWQESSYAGTLSIFIKLASPMGDPLSILKNITIPILTIMAAGSPITINGLTYGMPLIWDVRAYGITRFKVGALAALTISRGSYETVFNKDKQPLIVDVRLTIVPLVQDFAVQYTKAGNDCTKVNNKNGVPVELSAQEMVSKLAADGVTGITNATENAISGDYLKALTALMSTLISTMSGLVGCITGNEVPKLYGSINGLGVQSPGDEIDGLMGIAIDDAKKIRNFKEFPESFLYSI